MTDRIDVEIDPGDAAAFAPIACESQGGTRITSIEPVSVCQNTGRSILARRVIRRHPFCVIGRIARHPRRALGPRLAIIRERPPGTSVPRSSREERGRPDWSQTDGRGRREKLRRVLGYPSRLGDRVLGDAVEGMNMLHHLGRPIAELGRDATYVLDQARRLKIGRSASASSQARTA